MYHPPQTKNFHFFILLLTLPHDWGAATGYPQLRDGQSVPHNGRLQVSFFDGSAASFRREELDDHTRFENVD